MGEGSVTDEVVEALRAALGERLVAVVLYGSRARGDARPASDWDLLLIAEGLPEHAFTRHLVVKRMLPSSSRAAVSVLSRTREEFENRLPSLYLDIALDGQVLYDPRGYAAERLTAIRQVIDDAGLYRVRTPAGDLWRWREEPARPWVLDWKQ